jgi:hypothetical protein
MIRSLLLLSAVLLSCRQLPDSEAEPLRANIRAREIWRVHEAAVARAANYQPRDGDEFDRACAFFKEVTGIEIHGEGDFVGWSPTKDTLADLKVLRTWYQKNADRLRAGESGHVTVIAESKRGSH